MGAVRILTAIVTVWSLQPFKALFAANGALAGTVLKFRIPGLDQMVIKAAPIVATPKAYDAVLKLDLLSAVGTAILLTALISAVLLRMKPRALLATFAETLVELARPVLSIGLVLAFAFVANYSGMSSTLALLLAGTGAAFPFFSPFLGWLGVFLTGSDTSSNALFCALQNTTAHQIGVSDTLLVAANTTGGVTAKMISPPIDRRGLCGDGTGGEGVGAVPIYGEAQPAVRGDHRHYYRGTGVPVAGDDSGLMGRGLGMVFWLRHCGWVSLLTGVGCFAGVARLTSCPSDKK